MSKLGAVIEEHDPTIVDLILAAVQRRGHDDDSALDIYLRLADWKFRLNGRANSRLGICRMNLRVIELHARLTEFPDDYRITLVHEIAHALDYLLYGTVDGHGPRWQSIMRDLGAKPVTCGDHSQAVYDAIMSDEVQRAAEIWACQKCGQETPIARKRKYPAHNYRHRGCGGSYTVVDIRR